MGYMGKLGNLAHHQNRASRWENAMRPVGSAKGESPFPGATNDYWP